MQHDRKIDIIDRKNDGYYKDRQINVYDKYRKVILLGYTLYICL